MGQSNQLEELYAELKRIFEQSLNRTLTTEEYQFINWVARQQLKYNNKS